MAWREIDLDFYESECEKEREWEREREWSFFFLFFDKRKNGMEVRE